MNQSLQLDLHPEAEILNAFAEHALSPAEQQPVLTHLSECSRCRQIVFLAQEAAATEEHPAPVTIPAPSLISRWWSTRRILWLAAPACAALLTIAVLFHIKPVISPTESARVTNQPIQPAKRPSASSNMNRALPNPSSETTAQTAGQKSSRLRDKSLPDAPPPTPASPALPSKARSIQPAPVSLPQSAASSATVNVTSESVVLAPPIVSADTAQIEPVTPQQLPPAPSSFINANSKPATISVHPNPSAQASVALKPQASSSARTAPASSRGTVPPPPHAIPNAAARPGIGQAFAPGVMLRPGMVNMNRAPMPKQAYSALADLAARQILYTKLPNGLTAVSTAAVFNGPTQHPVLALDTAGSLFRSEDAGTTWQPVTTQWTGRPLQVRTQQIPASSSPSSSTPAPCPTCASKPVFSPAVKFELITDAVSTFTSTDGLNWTLKQEAAPPPKSEPQK